MKKEKGSVKMRKVLERCPACQEKLDVTQLSCSVCDTVIQGSFSSCLFCKLSPDSLHFLEIFVKNRGNLKEMERELGRTPFYRMAKAVAGCNLSSRLMVSVLIPPDCHTKQRQVSIRADGHPISICNIRQSARK